MNALPNIVLVHGRLGGRLVLERRHRAPAGRWLHRHRTRVPRDFTGGRRGPAPAGTGPPARADEAIPPDAERQFAQRMGATTVEVPASHVAMVSHPDEVVQLIETAAQALRIVDAG